MLKEDPPSEFFSFGDSKRYIFLVKLLLPTASRWDKRVERSRRKLNYPRRVYGL